MSASFRIFACWLLICSSTALAQQAEQPNVFDLPRVQALQSARILRGVALLTAGKYTDAEQLLRAAGKSVPHDINAHYNLGCALARQGKTDEAFASLELAVKLGFRSAKHIEADSDLKSLHGDERFAALSKSAAEPLKKEEIHGWNYKVQPAEPADGQVLVTESNVAWSSKLGMFSVLVKFPEKAPQQPIAVGLGEVGNLLRQWQEEGVAAGNFRDLYDNHDGDHSNMNFTSLPQLTRVEFADSVKKRNLHTGLQRFFLYNAVTLGNSSTAITAGPFWRCQGRLALTQPGGAGRLYLQYRANQMYFYPEHRDHDPGHNGQPGQGHGDVFPANTPYLILSQGSSGSDRPFMNAVAQTLAAFRPDVKEKLTKAGMLAPTVQMIFRSSNTVVKSPEDYLTGAAHPTVFDGKTLDPLTMVMKAHDMRADSLPPLVQLKVVEEVEGVVGRDYFDSSPREHLLDTPCAIGRVVKSTRYQRRMVVSAAESKDLNDKPLKFHWVVLRGDAERIHIRTQNEQGSIAELSVPYHERRPIAKGSSMESNRVDIGVFAHNGDYYSAPAFISFFYLDNEKRVYDGDHRIVSVDYVDPSVRGNYVDPALDTPKDWRDEYRYGDDGALLGWTRIRGEQRQQFTPEGRLILQQDASGKPLKTAAVRYVAESRGKGVVALAQQTQESPDK